MRPDAVLTSVDAEPEHQRLARKAFTEAGFASNRYRLISGKALEVLIEKQRSEPPSPRSLVATVPAQPQLTRPAMLRGTPCPGSSWGEN